MPKDIEQAITEHCGGCKQLRNNGTMCEEHGRIESAITTCDYMKIRVRIKLNGQPLPERHGVYYDLATAEDVYLQPGEYQRIPLGIAMEVPEGYYCEMVPRSSTFERWGIIQTNSVGIYEQEYCGDGDLWFFPALAARETKIPKGTRICQFCVRKQPDPIRFIPVEAMDKSDRGGWGSTGE